MQTNAVLSLNLLWCYGYATSCHLIMPEWNSNFATNFTWVQVNHREEFCQWFPIATVTEVTC